MSESICADVAVMVQVPDERVSGTSEWGCRASKPVEVDFGVVKFHIPSGDLT